MAKKRQPVGQDYFFVYRDPKNDGNVEVRVNFQGQSASALPDDEKRTYTALRTSQELVNKWLRYIAIAGSGKEASTIYEYAKIMRYTLEWLALEPANVYGEPVPQSLLRLTHSDAVALLAWLRIPTRYERARLAFAESGVPQAEMRETPLAINTQNLRETCLHSFYQWLLSSDLKGIVKPKANPLKTAAVARQSLAGEGHYTRAQDRGLRTQQKTPVIVLEPIEYEMVLQAVPSVSSNRHNQALRDKLIIVAMTFGLMRPSELPLWSWSGVDPAKKEMKVLTVKNRRLHPQPRTVYLDDDLWKLMIAYSGEMRSLTPDEARRGPVVRSLRDESASITARVIDDLFGKLKDHFHQEAGLASELGQHGLSEQYQALARKLHPHILRKTGATYWAASGVELLYLATMMGHSDPKTTMRYYVAAEKLRIAERLHELAPRFKQVLAGRTDNNGLRQTTYEQLNKLGIRL